MSTSLAEAAVKPARTRRGIPTVGYIRVSKKRTDMISPELQRHAIQTWADNTGHEIVDWIEDIDRSGREFTKRRVGEVIAGIQAGQWKVVALWKWSRWGRNMKQSMVYLAKTEEAGGTVRAATEDFDTTTPFGKFSRTQFLAMAELESDLKAEGWKETHSNRRRNGLPHDSKPRLGYTYLRKGKEGRYVPDPETSGVVADLYRRYVAGTSMRALCRDLNERGFRTRTGKQWEPNALGKTLDTGFAAGFIRERTNQQKKNHCAISDFDIWRVGGHEPLIDLALWEEYKTKRLVNAGKPKRLAEATHRLSGLLVCGVEGCGGNMNSRYSGKWARHAWVCGKRERARSRGEESHEPVSGSNRQIEAAVLAWLEQQAQGGEDVEEQAHREQARTVAVSKIDTFEREVADWKRQSKRLQDGWVAGILTDPEYLREKQAEIAKGLQEAQEGLLQARAAAQAADVPEGPMFVSLRDAWDVLAPEDLQVALAEVIARVEIFPGPWSEAKVRVVPAWDPWA